jgi:hypothetical protein
METAVQETLQPLLEVLVKESPELYSVMERARLGELEETQAMQEMLSILEKDPTFNQKVTAASKRVLIPLIEAEAVAADNAKDLIFKPATVNSTKINPIVAGAYTERVQFDEDIPELRMGPMPYGIRPAVSVVTEAHDPVLIGKQLKEASDKLQKKLEAHHQKKMANLEAIAGGAPTETLALILKQGEALAKPIYDTLYGSAQTDLPEYKRGQVPVPVKASKSSGSTLAKMSRGERHEMAWRFLSTTQGRRSAVQVIQEMMLEDLTKAGVTPTTKDSAEKQKILASHEWTMRISGPGATQPAFSFLTTAARALAKGLLTKLGKEPPAQINLVVTAVNRLDDRIVGWSAKAW